MFWTLPVDAMGTLGQTSPEEKKKSAPTEPGALRKIHRYELVAIMVVIVVVPITIGMPAVAVFVPPTMAFIPAEFPRLVQIVARVVRLPAVPAVMLHGFVEPVISFGDAALATTVVIGKCAGRCSERQHAKHRDRGERHSGEKLLPSRLYGHGFSILHFSPLLDWGLGPKQ